MNKSNHDNCVVIVDETESLEDLVRHDPGVTYWQASLMVASILWNDIICNGIPPLLLFSIYLVLGGLYRIFPQNNICRVTLLVALALPIIMSAIFLLKFTRKFVNERYPPFESAQILLVERIRVGRAKRKDAYDLFLPPPSSDGTGTTNAKFGIVFFPGALVSHTSYAAIASKLSDRGILVIILSLEPLRCDNNVESSKRRVLNAINNIVSESEATVDEWVLSGHSYGAFMAIYVASEMKPGVSRLVFCGLREKWLDDISSRSNPPQVLLINGSEDKLVNKPSKKQKEAFRNSYPPVFTSSSKGSKGSTTHITIEGGNHAGFGHYGPQGMDGIRTITLAEQQEIFIKKTLEFLTADIKMEAEKE